MLRDRKQQLRYRKEWFFSAVTFLFFPSSPTRVLDHEHTTVLWSNIYVVDYNRPLFWLKPLELPTHYGTQSIDRSDPIQFQFLFCGHFVSGRRFFLLSCSLQSTLDTGKIHFAVACGNHFLRVFRVSVAVGFSVVFILLFIADKRPSTPYKENWLFAHHRAPAHTPHDHTITHGPAWSDKSTVLFFREKHGNWRMHGARRSMAHERESFHTASSCFSREKHFLMKQSVYQIFFCDDFFT